jgi:hypothetical protein
LLSLPWHLIYHWENIKFRPHTQPLIFTNNLFLRVQAAKICHQKFSKICGECEVYRKANLQCVTVIEEVIKLIEESLHLGVHIDIFFSFLGFWSFIILFYLALLYFMRFLWILFFIFYIARFFVDVLLQQRKQSGFE